MWTTYLFLLYFIPTVVIFAFCDCSVYLSVIFISFYLTYNSILPKVLENMFYK